MPQNRSTLLINATAQTVWQVLTQPEHVKKWQFGSDLITDWRIGSSIRFSTDWQGTIFEQWGEVIAFQANQHLAYSLFAPRPDLEDLPENYFKMTYTLSTENQQTRLEILQDDHRPNAKQEAPQGEENPILKGLKDLAESL
jgi:uncharacterized protein YndB with AHSA1/START domain